MRSVMLIAGMCESLVYDAAYDYIGIDHGALVCMQQQIPLQAAIGDFDSIEHSEYLQLQKYTKVFKLPSHKNETDSEEAIQYAIKQGYENIVLYGGLGGRIDHELANLYLMITRRYPITLMDEHNTIKVMEKGSYTIKREHKYLSFLALEKSCITETGVEYPLYEQNLTPSDIYAISNEIVNTYAQVTLHYGRLLFIQSDDAKHIDM